MNTAGTPPGYEHIELGTREGVATITLNRPERMNAFTRRRADHAADLSLAHIRGKSGDAREGVSAFLEIRDADLGDRVSDGLRDIFPGWEEPEYR